MHIRVMRARGERLALRRALDSLRLVYQPIVAWPRRRVIGYEALARTTVPPLTRPGPLFDAAERWRVTDDFGRRIRELAAADMARLPADTRLFLNLHPADLDDATLYADDGVLTPYAGRIVLELTERAGLGSAFHARGSLDALRRRGYAIALDDVTTGHNGLATLALVEPDILKVDRELVRRAPSSVPHRRVVSTLLRIGRELRSDVVCEGIETPAERDCLVHLGCTLFQGFLFGEPHPWMKPPRWPA